VLTDALARPFSRVGADVLRAAAGIGLLVLDVDGVLTDGGVYYSPDGGVSKRFSVQDGLGMAILRRTGIRVCVITGMSVSCVEARLSDMGVVDYYCGQLNKIGAFEELRTKYGFAYEQIAYVGDDWIDIPVMRLAGLPIATANAQPEVKPAARYVTEKCGGDGAVREVVRLLLHARGRLDTELAEWSDGIRV
jgi:3-deoxy-D-manno-octulosonate 8-phosphate phosphatase (KDO 8-P phosphatase)